MPTSTVEGIETILHAIIALRPRSIMEIGPGYGKFGHLAREYLDVYGAETWRDFKTRIDCCEIFPEYITDLHRAVYSSIVIGDARETAIEGYDLVLATDVIEHMAFATVAPFIRRILAHNRSMLIQVPYEVKPQGEVFGNHAETHVSQFNYAYFRAFGHCQVLPDQNLICVLSRDPLPELIGRKVKLRRIRAALWAMFPDRFARHRDRKARGRLTVGPI
jgi:hypothetical protein